MCQLAQTNEVNMKFGIGNTIIIEKPFMRMGRNHIGATGIVVDIRSYGSKIPTHYVVKFGCFKIPHIYMIEELESSCRAISELIKAKPKLNNCERR